MPCLQPATSGSLGLDLAASVDCDLLTSEIHNIPTGLTGPICLNGTPVGGLILGRSSATALGLFVQPGVVDADSQGDIFILAYTVHPPVRIPKGQRLAQFVPLPQATQGMQPLQAQPNAHTGCGSTGELTLLTINLNSRPRKPCALTYKGETITLQSLLDTGADSSIVDVNTWPSHWPLLPAMTAITGVGGMKLAHKSPLITVEIEGKKTTAIFSIAPLPPTVDCLIGRDVLAQMSFVLTDNHHFC